MRLRAAQAVFRRVYYVPATCQRGGGRAGDVFSLRMRQTGARAVHVLFHMERWL